MTEFTESVIEIIRSIPPGRTLSYGQVAAAAGNPRAARQVSRILHSCSDAHSLPWHRVISSSGKISLRGRGGAEQRLMLEAEGVTFLSDGRVSDGNLGFSSRQDRINTIGFHADFNSET